jgi:N-acetylneuraminic acid mutarotase
MPSARQELAVAEVGGKVYAIGGFGEGYEPVGTVEAYDPATNRWEGRASLPIPVHHPAAVSLGGKLYVLGGFTGRLSQVPQDSLFEYDPATNAWRTLASMPTPRGALGAAALDGKIHALGGS